MSVITLSRPQTQPSGRPRPLPGSPHWGGDWRRAVRHLRSAVENAVQNAKWGDPRFTPDKVGTEVIDLIGELNSHSLAVLHVLIGELAKQSRRNRAGYHN